MNYKIMRYPLKGIVEKEIPYPTTDEYYRMTPEQREENIRHLTTILTTSDLEEAKKKLTNISTCEFCTSAEWKNDGLVLIAERLGDGLKLVFAIVEAQYPPRCGLY